MSNQEDQIFFTQTTYPTKNINLWGTYLWGQISNIAGSCKINVLKPCKMFLPCYRSNHCHRCTVDQAACPFLDQCPLKKARHNFLS